MKMTSKNLNLLIVTIFVMVFFSITFLTLPLPALGSPTANEILQGGLDTTARTAGFETDQTKVKTPSQIVASVIQIALGFVGTLFLILIIVSGFQWMTAGGNSTTIETAKSRMINATIGLVIILAAYAITSFVMIKIIQI